MAYWIKCANNHKASTFRDLREEWHSIDIRRSRFGLAIYFKIGGSAELWGHEVRIARTAFCRSFLGLSNSFIYHQYSRDLQSTCRDRIHWQSYLSRPYFQSGCQKIVFYLGLISFKYFQMFFEYFSSIFWSFLF